MGNIFGVFFSTWIRKPLIQASFLVWFCFDLGKKINDLGNIFVEITDLENIFVKIIDLGNIFVKITDLGNIFVKITDLGNIFGHITDLSNIFGLIFFYRFLYFPNQDEPWNPIPTKYQLTIKQGNSRFA